MSFCWSNAKCSYQSAHDERTSIIVAGWFVDIVGRRPAIIGVHQWFRAGDFALTCILHDGRPSWHMVLWPLTSVGLSMITLNYTRLFWGPSSPFGPSQPSYPYRTSCTLNGSILGTSLSSLCGSGSSVFDFDLQPTTSMIVWTWVLWPNAILWALYSTL